MDRKAFFDKARAYFGPLTQVQVDVTENILDLTPNLSNEHVAYIIATAWGEAKLTPVRENMNYTARRIAEVWPNRQEAIQFAGRPKELANSVYGGRLGNRPGTNDGWDYRGGGVDQLTGRDNYKRVGLADNPDAILRPDKAAWSIVHGMTTGRYTGKRLADYGDGAEFKPVGARAIVNGDVKVNGQRYARFYREFLDCLRASDRVKSAKIVHLDPPPVDHVPVKPAPAFSWADLFRWSNPK